jgi:hypothetical protein
MHRHPAPGSAALVHFLFDLVDSWPLVKQPIGQTANRAEVVLKHRFVGVREPTFGFVAAGFAAKQSVVIISHNDT